MPQNFTQARTTKHCDKLILVLVVLLKMKLVSPTLNKLLLETMLNLLTLLSQMPDEQN